MSKVFIFRLAIFLALFPEIGLIRLPSDAQPYFLIVMILGLLTNFKRNNKYSLILFPFLFILILALGSFTVSIINTNDIFTLFRSLFGYASSFIVLYFLFCYKEYFTARIVIPILDFSVKFIYLGFILNLIGLNRVVQLFINRSEFRFDGARGLVSFYSEQSNMVTACFVIVFLYLHFRELNFKRGFFVIGAILLSASGQAVLEVLLVSVFYFTSYLLYILLKQRINKSFFKYLISSISFLFLLGFTLQNTDFEFRAFKIFKDISLDSSLYILGSDYSMSWKVQGIFLAISTLIADPFNFQISSLTETDAHNRLFNTHDKVYDFVFGVSNPQFGDRVYSAFGTWIVDFGLIGLLFYLIFVILFIKNIFKNNYYSPLIFTSILYVLYVTMIKVGLSTPTIFLVVFSTYCISFSPKRSVNISN